MYIFDYYKTEIANLLKCDENIVKFWWDRYEQIDYEYIVYQTEVLDLEDKRSSNYLSFLNNAKEVYDYSVTNLKWNPKSIFRPYLPNTTSTVINVNKDIDVLFYGGLSQRRRDIIDKLSKIYNITYVEKFGSIEEHKNMIARSNYVLSIGFADNNHNDLLRITPALNFGANILLEHNTEIWVIDYLNKYFSDRIKFINI